jgi:integrase
MEMPRKLPLFVYREITRHGRTVWYFRRRRGRRVRLPDYGSEGFDHAYQAALTGTEPPRRAKSTAGSLRWLIDRYRETAQYRSLSTATRRQRDYIFGDVLDSAGSEAFRDITRRDIRTAVERREHTPSQARNFLDAMRGVFRWALDAELIDADPTASVKNPPRPKTGGFRAWSEDDIAAFERRWPVGTREHVWLHVLLYTGLRRGDAVLLGRQHVRGGVATLRTEKNDTEVNIPILPILAETLAVGPTGDLAFIVGDKGHPITKESFGNVFKKACVAAGLMNHNSHGVRKIGATRAAEAGATVAELEALFGWHGGAMASLYTRTADRKRLARQAAEKIGNIYGPHLNPSAGSTKIK